MEQLNRPTAVGAASRFPCLWNVFEGRDSGMGYRQYGRTVPFDSGEVLQTQTYIRGIPVDGLERCRESMDSFTAHLLLCAAQ